MQRCCHRVLVTGQFPLNRGERFQIAATTQGVAAAELRGLAVGALRFGVRPHNVRVREHVDVGGGLEYVEQHRKHDKTLEGAAEDDEEQGVEEGDEDV